jgi:hypothetical protein
MYNLRTIPGFKTLKAFKFSNNHWRIIDCVTNGTKTDPYFASIGPLFETLGSLIAYAQDWYFGQYF